MKTPNRISCILFAIAMTSGVLASGVPERADWFVIAKPYFIVSCISFILGILVGNLNSIRRYTYPLFTCACAWVYKHKLLMTKFTRSAFLVYKLQKSSYKRLFTYTQDMFDIYLEAIQ